MPRSTPAPRNHTKRVTSALATTALIGAAAVATTGVTHAEESEPTLRTFDAADFADEAAKLPAELRTAVRRDLSISAADYLADAEAAKLASDTAVVLRADGVDVQSVAIDEDQSVTYYVGSEADVAAAEVTGATAVVGKPPPAEVSIDSRTGPWARRDPKGGRDLKGGFGYLMFTQEGASAGSCSVGFNGYAPGGGHRYLSAGHCGLAGPGGPDLGATQHLDMSGPLMNKDAPVIDPEERGEPIGRVIPGLQRIDDSGHDGGGVDVTNPDWRNVPLVSQWGGGRGHPGDGAVTVYDHIAPVIGAPYCKSGFRAGLTCGEITHDEFTDDWGGGIFVTGFRGTACGAPGDSGGANLIGNYAVGTTSGGSTMVDDEGRPLPNPQCDADWRPEFYNVSYRLIGGEISAFNHFGEEFELNVAVNAPDVAVETSGTTAIFTGSVDNASINHRVEVSIARVGTFETDLDANGEFTLRVDGLGGPEPRVYIFSARAQYGEFSTSETTRGLFLVE